ncbi:MAG TPA: serine hydrolase domain-containing protein [Bacteroidales bacterium]
MKLLNLFLLMLILSFNLHGQKNTLENDITNYAKEKGFSGTILIQKDDSIIYHKSFGLANRQFNIPNNNETRYHIASITKLFTSVLILHLHEAGKIDLNQPIKTYLPDYKGEGVETVTIHHLLTHTSGIKNCEEIGPDVEIYRMPNTIDNIVTKYCSGELTFQPGTRFSYNNGEYILLGKIIEMIYNKPYEQVLAEKLLEPLNMKNSGMIDHSKIIKNLACAYLFDNETQEYKNNPPFNIENYFASGAMYSTTTDLLKFSNALYGGKILNENSVKLLLQTTPVTENYGYGLWIYSIKIKNKELKAAYRPGGCMGTNTLLNYYLNEGLTIVILANTNKILNQDVKNFNQVITELIMK